jgi:hypothetical protein
MMVPVHFRKSGASRFNLKFASSAGRPFEISGRASESLELAGAGSVRARELAGSARLSSSAAARFLLHWQMAFSRPLAGLPLPLRN